MRQIMRKGALSGHRALPLNGVSRGTCTFDICVYPLVWYRELGISCPHALIVILSS